MNETILLWILGAGFGLVFTILGVINSKLDSVKDSLEKTKDELMDEVAQSLEREKKESIIADKRLGIHDRIASAITDKPFDSKLIATGSGEIPSTRRIQKLMDTERAGNA